MAGYRQIHTRIWKDEWFGDLAPDEKLLFIYLFSNDEAQISGIYKISLKVIANETGLDRQLIKDTLQKFADDKKVLYQDGVVWVVNMGRYHKNGSPHTMKKVESELDLIPECEVKIRYREYNNMPVYGIDTVSDTFQKNLEKNVILSVSVNKSVSESVSDAPALDNPSPASSPVLYPSDQAEAMSIFSNVTGAFGLPASERDAILEAIRILRKSKSFDETIAYLKPFYEKFRATAKSKSRAYWLTDWAITGSAPDGKKTVASVEPSERF